MELTDYEKEHLELYAFVLRCLRNYHKRMTMNQAVCECEDKKACGGKCPNISGMDDMYLGALECSLKLIENEIQTLQYSKLYAERSNENAQTDKDPC